MFARIVRLLDQIKMAKVVITLKVMPDSPEVDLDALESEVLKTIKKFLGDVEYKKEIEPVAFGLKAIKIIFVMDESFGSTDELEDIIRNLDNVNSVEVVDVRRAIG